MNTFVEFSGKDAALVLVRMKSSYSMVVENDNDSTHSEEDTQKHKFPGTYPYHIRRELNEWLVHHLAHPRPTAREKMILMRATGLTMMQINNYYANMRRRALRKFQHDRKGLIAYLRAVE